MRINSPLNHTEVPRTFSGLRADTHKSVHNGSKGIRSVKSSWGLHENVETRRECSKCVKLIQIINEKNSAIEELEKEKQALKEKLNLALKSSMKLDRRKPIAQRGQLDKLRNFPPITSIEGNKDFIVDLKSTSYTASKKDSMRSPLGLKKAFSPKNSLNNKINASLTTLKNLENYIKGIKMDIINNNEPQEVKTASKGLFYNELNDLKRKIKILVKAADEH